MKKKHAALWITLVISGALVAGTGAYLKYQILRPVGLLQDENIISVPFILMRDSGVRRVMQDHYEEKEPVQTAPSVETVPETMPLVTTAPTAPPATVPPTEPPTLPVSEPEAPSVEESWFDDVLFIGDSRIVGQRNNTRLGKADYFCDVGMTVYNAMEWSVNDVGFEETRLQPLLESKKYGKIIISLGLNESYLYTSSIIDGYRELIGTIRQSQPDAVFILNGIMTLGRWKSSSQPCFALSNIYAINEAIEDLAAEAGAYYIDINPFIADAEGYLPSELSGDGCHLYMTSDPMWARWLRQQMAQLDI